MEKIKPLYKKLLAAAIALYVIGTAAMFSDLYYKVCNIEHTLAHSGAACGHKAAK